jgi:hypothetical protein
VPLSLTPTHIPGVAWRRQGRLIEHLSCLNICSYEAHIKLLSMPGTLPQLV